MSAPTRPPTYKGEPLDAERGPGLGCFWIQIGLLVFFLVFTPLTVIWGWDSRISATLLIFTLVLLLFAGQTVIFLLRLVASDRRTRRTPRSPDARPTVGQLEEQAGVDAAEADAAEATVASAGMAEADAAEADAAEAGAAGGTGDARAPQQEPPMPHDRQTDG